MFFLCFVFLIMFLLWMSNLSVLMVYFVPLVFVDQSKEVIFRKSWGGGTRESSRSFGYSRK